MEDKTKAQLKSNFLNGLSPFANPNVANATDGNDFDLRQVRKKRMTIYFCISGDNAGWLKNNKYFLSACYTGES